MEGSHGYEGSLTVQQQLSFVEFCLEGISTRREYRLSTARKSWDYETWDYETPQFPSSLIDNYDTIVRKVDTLRSLVWEEEHGSEKPVS